ncbi:MAG: hypothetical protein J7604_02550 [Sporocytophaga sp.]|uniref:hypothetical protein n=1 Tax=Sporocytophaga sp. TaxID=2231183 RepID=UPI001B1E3F2A|nr:hypothetical protein [Sporocytophaga sp.]MBO9699058.1 hypothetical protein [Sporocytophaga sp.]
MRTFNKQEKRIFSEIVGLSKRGAKIISPILFLENLLNLRSQLYIIKAEDTSHMSEVGSYPFCRIEVSGNAADVYNDYFGLTQRLSHITDFIDYLLTEKYLVIRKLNIHSSFYFNKIDYLSEALENEDPDVVKIDLKITPTIAMFLEKCSYYYTPTDALIQLHKNNFRTGLGIDRRIKKPSFASLVDYLLGISSDWNNNIYKRKIHRPINVRSHKNTFHTKGSQDNTDLVYLSMLEN